MIKISKNIPLFILLFGGFTSLAQVTANSPYSRFGLGTVKGPFLPQNIAMGSISTGIRSIGFYNNINIANPASYSGIRLTTIDVGAFSEFTSLSTASYQQKVGFNAALSHLAFAVPVSKKSGVSFGLVPYTNLGYQYSSTTKVDTNTVKHIYTGDGGLSKAYLGYGRAFGKHLSVGANFSYLFGTLVNSASTEFPNDSSQVYLNSRTSKSNSISGINFDYGVQYYKSIGATTQLTIGYSGSYGNKINSTSTDLTTHYVYINNTNEDVVEQLLDTTHVTRFPREKIKLPSKNSLGFTIENTGKWLVGADVTSTNWSDFRQGATDPGLNNSLSVQAGGQFTPDQTAVNNYWKLVDYRFGLKYDKTFIRVNGTNIIGKTLSLGMGLPLPSNRGVAFYKINFAAELSELGTQQHSLIRERRVNLHLGFTLNDKWFQKFKFD